MVIRSGEGGSVVTRNEKDMSSTWTDEELRGIVGRAAAAVTLQVLPR
jgi:hypothetical protein